MAKMIDLGNVIGPRGPEGQPGKDGAPGPEGKPGKDGAPGPEGKPGKDGAPGTQGYSLQYHWDGTSLGIKREDEGTYQYQDLQGLPGKDGAPGPEGKPGKDGAPGADGTKIYTQANAPTGVAAGTVWIDK